MSTSWLRSTGFLGDVQASLMDVPFDGSHLFSEKADSAVERFKESRVMAQCLDLHCPTNPTHPFVPFMASVVALRLIHHTPGTLGASRQPSFSWPWCPQRLWNPKPAWSPVPAPPPAATSSKSL